jgi:hypothetical protein
MPMKRTLIAAAAVASWRVFRAKTPTRTRKPTRSPQKLDWFQDQKFADDAWGPTASGVVES